MDKNKYQQFFNIYRELKANNVIPHIDGNTPYEKEAEILRVVALMEGVTFLNS